jgi:protein-tyrosine phosphatase
VSPALPQQQTSGPYRIAVVCLGNIRSPMAHVVLRERLAAAGLGDRVLVRSGGTADWHTGKDMDPRSAATLRAHGYDPTGHRAAQYLPDWQLTEDLVLVMDRANLADAGGRTERLRLFRDFDPIGTGGEVPDPYYGGEGDMSGFEEVLDMVERTSEHLVTGVSTLLARPASDAGLVLPGGQPER